MEFFKIVNGIVAVVQNLHTREVIVKWLSRIAPSRPQIQQPLTHANHAIQRRPPQVQPLLQPPLHVILVLLAIIHNLDVATTIPLNAINGF
tara:strand:- start:11985 stop:12257 length:273 start_codon:yes stop_codon:yes gene_type:complete